MCSVRSGPSAAELLEASKKLYVKTDVLRQRKIEPTQPRMFVSPHECDFVSAGPIEDHVVLRIPSETSAFRPIQIPPVPPKSDRIRQRIHRLQEIHQQTPPPLPPRRSENAVGDDFELAPTPKPRISKMKSMFDLSLTNERPQPKPRRKTTMLMQFPLDKIDSFEMALQRKNTKSSITSSTSCSSVAALKRKANHRNSLSSYKNEEQENVNSFPVMDDSERAFLSQAIDRPYSPSESGSSAPLDAVLRCPKRATVSGTEMHSPTTDSGIPASDDEEKRTHPCSNKSEDGGFFDASGQPKDDDADSEKLTSVSNAGRVPVETVLDEDDRGRGLTILEKNARVMKWIHGCQKDEC